MRNFCRITEKTLKDLESISGKEALLTSDKDLEGYSRDETPGIYGKPEAVLRPSSPGEISELVRLALDRNFPVTPRGGGTSLSGGPVPLFGGVVLSFERMRSIEDIDTENRMALLQPGVVNGILQTEAEKLGLFYPVNPASMDSCTMGGNVAQATGGANTVRYGTTRNYLTGLEAVSGSGNLWSCGGKVLKNSTDQALLQLACGSEGTLSIFTRFTFRLLNRSPFTTWIIAPFSNILDIPGAASRIIRQGLNPTMVELMDDLTLKCCSEHTGIPRRFPGMHQLLVRFDSDDGDRLEELSFTAGEVCAESGAADVFAADTKARQQQIWKIRSSIHEALGERAGSICEEDVVVPRAGVGKMIKKAYETADKYSMPAAVFGHLGDGNLHINLTGKDNSDPGKTEKAREEIFSAAIKLGGKISGEHGIGITKKKAFQRYADKGYIELLRGVKKVFDPENILNPGKLCP